MIRVLAFAERMLLNFRQLREMSCQQRYRAIKRRLLLPRLALSIFHLRADRKISFLRRIARHQGMGSVYWGLRGQLALHRGWSAVQNHILLLAKENSAGIDRFIAAGLRLSDDPLILVGLAQHPLSTPALARALARERSLHWPELDARLIDHGDYAVAFLVATALTGDDAAMDHAHARISSVMGESFLKLLESFGQRPADAMVPAIKPLHDLRRNGLRTRKRHRLIIAENFQDPESFLPLLCGTDRVTLLGLKDTFGKAAFIAYQNYPTVGEIVVEHIRSRITRFSQNYVDVHSQTRDTAIGLAAILNDVPDLVPPGDLLHIELAIADHLFFPMLRLRAIEELLADPGFDHIVVTTCDHVPTSDYVLTLAGVRHLTSDPRVELMSLSRSLSQRMAFGALLPAILAGPKPMSTAEAGLPLVSGGAAELWHHACSISASLPPMPKQAAPRNDAVENRLSTGSVLLATTSNTAYDFSTAYYAGVLSRNFSIAFAICGGIAAAVQRELSKTGIAPFSVPFRLLPREYLSGNTTAFARWLVGQVALFCEQRGPGDKVAHVISCAPDLLVDVIQSQIMHGQVLEAWFSRMAAAGGLPDAIALSAARAPMVSQFAAAARRHGVPTLTLEAHGLNANYCRYAKVSTDYYGVISEQFRQDGASGFGIGLDRVRVLGTPRIIAAPAREPAKARVEIAAALGEDFPLRPGGVVSFFSQPSNWLHVAQVWRLVLAAAQELDLQVLLKPHPEETASRFGQYSAIASQMQAEDRVQLVTASPSVLIEASNVVLTCYSAAALDAAVMGRPVICVTVGDTVYPVDQHVIARAPLVHDLGELCAALRTKLSTSGAEAYAAFLAAEPQFAGGLNERLYAFMAEIIAQPAIRPPADLPPHLFLDPPHPVFEV